MTLLQKRDQLVDDLRLIEDPHERLSWVINRGRRHPELPFDLKVDAFRVEGCISQLWLVPEFRDGKCYFRTESDSAIVKGIAAVLCEFYSDTPPAEIPSVDPSFLGEVGITQHLSPNRRNGLSQIWKRIRSFAESCLAAEPGT